MKDSQFCAYWNEQWQIVHVGASAGRSPATRKIGPETAAADEDVRQEEKGHSAQQPAAEELAGQRAVRALQSTQRSVQVTLNKTNSKVILMLK
jgi:hypothetical protein